MEQKKHKTFCCEAGDLRGLICELSVGRWMEYVYYLPIVDYFDDVLFGPEFVFERKYSRPPRP
jgi:hypothetical protein